MSFEDLDSWQKARQLVRELYLLTRQPELARDFGLCGQLQRAGVSVMSNVAEGFERKHILEKLQFYNVGRGSAAEVRSLLYVIEDNYPAVMADAMRLRAVAAEVSKLMTGLIRSTEKRRLA